MSPTTPPTGHEAPSTPTPDAGGPGPKGTALVTGVTGYVGRLLVEPLLDSGWRVKALTRSAGGLSDAPWRDRVEVVEGDAVSEADLARAMDGVDVAYFMLHSMDGHGDFIRRDRDLAARFARAAEGAGVRRIVYLGGLHPEGELSEHLGSRVEVGKVFLDSDVPAACLQAAIILGDGSSSFEMLWHLTQRLPVMVAPKWLRNRIQPIAIRDVLHYLVAAADLPPEVNRTFDIGGRDVLTYVDMINRLARIAVLGRRLVVTVPVLTPKLASYWVGLVTPVSPGLAKPLVGSLVHEVVCSENDIARYVPDPPGGRLGYDDAVRAAMAEPGEPGGDDPGPREDRSHRRNLALAMTATSAAAFVNALAADRRAAWMADLDLPRWKPPNEAFPVIWTVLYADIAATTAAAVTAFQDADEEEEAAAFWGALALNLGLNAGWSLLFFFPRSPWVATGQLAALTASSADLARRSADAGSGHRLALAPYVGWCAFATVLYAEIARRNPGAGGCRCGD